MSSAYSYFEQAKHLIVERARNLAKEFIENRGHDRPPFLAEDYARLLGIENFPKADLKKTSALLVKFQDSYLIKVNEKHHPFRQNFSVAHEIGHILYNKLHLDRYIGNVEYRTYNPQITRMIRGNTKERLCDIAAKELLMPESVFTKYLTSFGLLINSIEPLSHVFRTSIPATAYRISEVSTEPCLILVWKPWPANKPRGLRYVGSRSKLRPIPMHTFITFPSKLQTAFESFTSVKSSGIFKIHNSKKNLPLESKGFGYGENRYVISLAFLDR